MPNSPPPRRAAPRHLPCPRVSVRSDISSPLRLGFVLRWPRHSPAGQRGPHGRGGGRRLPPGRAALRLSRPWAERGAPAAGGSRAAPSPGRVLAAGYPGYLSYLRSGRAGTGLCPGPAARRGAPALPGEPPAAAAALRGPRRSLGAGTRVGSAGSRGGAGGRRRRRTGGAGEEGRGRGGALTRAGGRGARRSRPCRQCWRQVLGAGAGASSLSSSSSIV